MRASLTMLICFLHVAHFRHVQVKPDGNLRAGLNWVCVWILCDLKHAVPEGTVSVKARTSWEGPADLPESRGESTHHVVAVFL